MTTTDAKPTAVGLRSERGPVLLAIMLATGLVAIDATILATAVPSITGDLGGFALFPWLFSAYLLAQAVSTPLFGKASDLLGRRPVMMLGIGLFVGGSVLCGFAWSMPVLIVARAVQGLGAGAVMPMSLTMIGDLYTVAERARVQAYVASVWGASAVVGPTLGGVFSEYLSWRWIFFVNVPLGLLAAVMLLRGFTERVERTRRSIDVAGATLLVVGGSSLVLGLLQGGTSWPWLSVRGVGVFVLAVLALAAFVLVERRAAEPVLPGWIFTRRLLVGTNLANVGIGALVVGLSSYVPLYVEGVLGHGALVGGFALAAMMVGWPVAASFVGRIYLRIGFRDTGLIGSVVVVLGAGSLVLLSASSGVWQVALSCLVIGAGLGLVASPTLVAAQSSVGWEQRGVVTGTQLFSRSMGSAVGVAVFGAVANAAVASRLGADAVAGGSVPADVLAPAIHQVFVLASGVGLIVLVALVLMPRRNAVEE
ncbi:MAG: MDR family MFS transporter [Nocardioidaceae bacterium]|nr:MDR family MFS transporter [Nocardioidaceae bacterium]